MNRREFTKGLAALGVTPALPLPALAKAAPIAGMATDPMYVWAQFITRVHDKCSPAMLSRLLKLETSHAEGLYADLLKNGVIGPANSFGISRATDPLYQEYAKIGAKQVQTINPNQETANKPKLKSSNLGDEAGKETEDESDSLSLNQAEPNSEHEPDDFPDSELGDSDNSDGRA